MKCPKCSIEIKSLNELSSSESDIPWYKYNEELTSCPSCKTQVKIIAPKRSHVLFGAFFILYTLLAIAAFLYSPVLLFVVIFFTYLTAWPLAEYLYLKNGELVEDNT